MMATQISNRPACSAMPMVYNIHRLTSMAALAATTLWLLRRSTSTAFLLTASKRTSCRRPASFVRFMSISMDSAGDPSQAENGDVIQTPHRSLPQVIRLRGVVDSGYGRGGKKLGFPTANLPESLFAGALENISTGVYFGWAVIEGTGEGRNEPHKAAVNVGYSPTFEGKENREKIVEAHLILEEGDTLSDFYNETMRLALSGFLRPEQKFDSFPDLVAAIGRDVVNAKNALSLEPFVSLISDPFIADPCSDAEKADTWVGQSGGDALASWEFQDLSDAIAASQAQQSWNDRATGCK